MANNFLQIKNLNAGYGPLKVLFGVSMHVNPNEIVVLIGPNGAGKSTVLKSIFKLVDVYKGSILFQKKSLLNLHTYDLIKLGISIVPQGRQVFSTLTVEENLDLGAFLTREKEVIEERKKEVLSHFPELKQRLNDRAYTLSGGQQQMLAMARALMQDPKLLLLDEPSLGLSPKMMKLVFEKVKDINKEGTAILMVEQNAKQAVKLADRIYVLEEGKVRLHGTKEILKRKEIQHIYLGGHGH